MMLTTPARYEKSGFLAEMNTSTKIPYSYLIDDETIETKSGHLLQTIKIEGLFAETMDDDLIDHEMNIRNTLLMSLADSTTSLYFHTVRKKATCVLNGNFKHAFVENLQNKWNEHLQQKQFFINEHYLTIVKKPPVGKVRKLTDIFKTFNRKFDEEARRIYRNKMLADLNKISGHVLMTLSSYGAKKLSMIYDKKLDTYSSEMLSFLSYLINLADLNIVPPTKDLATYLPYKRLFFDATTGTIAFRDIQNKSKYAAIISIKDYCGKTRAGLLDNLLDIPAEMMIAQSFSFLDTRYAREKIKEQERNLAQSDEGETSANEKIYVALDKMGSGESMTGEHHLSILCHADTLSELEKSVGLINAALNQLGIIAIREDKGIKPAYFSLLPANHAYIIRRAQITSENIAAFASLHNYSIGKAKGNHWGDAITILETISGTPYYFNFHVLDVANTFMIGPQGSGKTLLQAFLLAHTMKYGGRLIAFDKDKGLEIFIRAMNGTYSTLSAGSRTGFAPFQMDDSEENRYFLTNLLRTIATSNGQQISDEELGLLKEAVDGAYQLPKKDRILRNIVPFLRMRKSGTLRMRFESWVDNGSYAWAFDNEIDSLSLDHDVCGFDVSTILSDDIVRSPLLFYLFHRVEEKLDGTRTRIVGAEIWRALQDETFREKLRDWSSTPRKKEAFLLLDTQTPEDIATSEIGCKIIQESVTQIYFANPKGSHGSYVKKFGLSKKEFEIIKTLDKKSRYFLLKQGKNSVVARIDMSGFENEISVLSGKTKYSEVLDRVRAQWGDDSAIWLPHYYQDIQKLDNETI